MVDFILNAGMSFHILLALAGLGCFAFAMKDKFSKVFVGGQGVLATAFLVAQIVYAAVKPYTNQTRTDENIHLLSFSAEPIEVINSDVGTTNIVGVIYTIVVDDTSSAPQPIWYRDSNSENWTNYALTNGWETAQPRLVLETASSNVYQWVNNVITNNFAHQQWYIGTELPNVIIDVDDEDVLKIEEWSMTASNIKIRFTVSDSFTYPEGTVIQIQRGVNIRSYRMSSKQYSEYETVDTIPIAASGTYTWNGFEVGRSTRWRLHITIIKED